MAENGAYSLFYTEKQNLSNSTSNLKVN